MTYEVMLTQRAEEDIRDIYEYGAYELAEPTAASDLVKRLYETCESLGSYPERHQVVDVEPWRSRNARFVKVGNYLVFYTVDKHAGTVHVFRVMYGGRDVHFQLSMLLGRGE